MQLNINGKVIHTDEQGYLRDPADWDEDVASALAHNDGIELFVDHWELIWYFRDYFEQTESLPTMHRMVLELGKHRGRHFRDQKAYEKHIYSLFPADPVRQICKLAGLPMPPPDT